MEIIKVITSLMPIRAKVWTMNTPMTNAGNALMKSTLAATPGLIQMVIGSQATQLSEAALQGTADGGSMRNRSESRRIDDQ